MKQKLLKTMLLLCALIVGGSAWADVASVGTTLWSEDFSGYAADAVPSGDITNSHTGTTVYGGVTLTYGCDNGGGTTKIYTDGGPSTGANLLIAKGNGTFSISGISTGGATELTVSYDKGGQGTIAISSSTTGVTISGSTITTNGASTLQLTFKNTHGSKNLRIDDIVVTVKTAGSSSSAKTTTTSIDASGITNTNKYVSTEAGSLSASVTYGDPAVAVPTASVTWSGNNDAVATINATTGAVTLVGAGTVTFTATYAGVEDEYASSSDTYEMTVTDEDPSLVIVWSEDFSTYSANDVPTGGTYSYACTNGSGTTKIYANNNAGGTSPELLVGNTNGTFTAVVPLLNEGGGYGYSGDLKLKYKTNANSLNVKSATSGITVKGEVNEGDGLTFNTAGEHEITFEGTTLANSTLTIVFTATGSNVRLDDIVLKGLQEELTYVSTPVISPASGAVVSGSKVTITCATPGATIYYTTNGSTPTTSSSVYNPESKPTVTAAMTIKAYAVKDGKTDSEVATATYTLADPCATPTFSVAEGVVDNGTTVSLSCDTDGATIYYTTNGSTPSTSSSVYSSAITINSNQTIKAIAAKEGYANSEVASATYTLRDYVNLPFDYDGNGTGTLPTGLTVSGTSTYASSPKIQFNSTGDYVILKTGQALGFVSFDVKGNSFSGGTFTVQTSADGESYTNLASYTSLNSTTETKSYYNLSSDIRYIKWIYTTKSSGNVALGKINVGKPVKFNSEGYATFASASDLDFTGKDYTAWIVTAISGDVITFSKVTEAPASTGLLLMGTAGNTANITTTSDVAALSETNLLTGITSATAVAVDKFYGLSGNKFVKVNAGTVPAGKALLPASEVSEEIKSFTFIFNDSETGITETRTVSREVVETIFDLNGRRLSQPQKGINIINGRKVVVK